MLPQFCVYMALVSFGFYMMSACMLKIAVYLVRNGKPPFSWGVDSKDSICLGRVA